MNVVWDGRREPCVERIVLERSFLLATRLSHDYLSSSEKPGINGIGAGTEHQYSSCEEDT